MQQIHWATGLECAPVLNGRDQAIGAYRESESGEDIHVTHDGKVESLAAADEISFSHNGVSHPSASQIEDGNPFNNVVIKDRRTRAERALHESRQELQRLCGLLVTIQEDERKRIALDLHDGLGQILNLIKLSIENTARIAPMATNDAVVDALQQIVPQVKEALVEVRRVSMELRPPMLDDLGILPTLTWLLREFESTCGHIAVDKQFKLSEPDVPAPLKITLFRIVQEATNNIVKHAGASQVRVCLERNGDLLSLLVADNGCGFDSANVVCSEVTGRGLGLLSMKERAVSSGGSYRLESIHGQGTRIHVTWSCRQ